jgi:hypothetical protein
MIKFSVGDLIEVIHNQSVELSGDIGIGARGGIVEYLGKIPFDGVAIVNITLRVTGIAVFSTGRNVARDNRRCVKSRAMSEKSSSGTGARCCSRSG